MMTQTHTLLAATLLASPQRPVRHNAAVVLGSLVPDFAIYVLFIWSKFAGIPERQLWREIYFSEPMLTFTAISNSFPLYLVILLTAIMLYKTHQKIPSVTNEQLKGWAIVTGTALGLFALAAITHLMGDFPVHANDAHPHFWPVTDWRFHSPVSYWNRRQYGDVFSLFEAALGVILSIILFRRFKAKWVRALTAIAILAYIAVPLYFSAN